MSTLKLTIALTIPHIISIPQDQIYCNMFYRTAIGDSLMYRATEYTEWQRPLSGVHSIMMEKLAQDP